MNRLVAATLSVVLLAAPVFAGAVSDDGFAAALNVGRVALLDQAQKSKRGTTQETGPNDPLLLRQAPILNLVKKVMPSVAYLSIEVPPAPGDASAEGQSGHRICSAVFLDVSSYHMNRRTLLVTNAHCVEGLAIGAEIAVGLYRGNINRPIPTRARVLAIGDSNAAKDIAFAELTEPAKTPAGLPLWQKLDPGEEVVAIGHPLGMTYSVSKGIVSAVGRDHLSSSLTLSMDQHDAAVNPGNSGGPLFNLWGSVVGLNVGIRTESGGFEGISLTVPARLIDEALRQFARTGNLSVSSLRAALRATEEGVSLLKIAPGAAVGVAGAQEGDRVINVDGEDLTVLDPLEALTALLLRVRYKSPGETIQLTLKRGAATVPAAFRLEAPPPPTPPAVESPAPEPSKSEPPTPSSGLFDP